MCLRFNSNSAIKIYVSSKHILYCSEIINHPFHYFSSEWLLGLPLHSCECILHCYSSSSFCVCLFYSLSFFTSIHSFISFSLISLSLSLLFSTSSLSIYIFNYLSFIFFHFIYFCRLFFFLLLLYYTASDSFLSFATLPSLYLYQNLYISIYLYICISL